MDDYEKRFKRSLRTKSDRLKGWDYTGSGWYFVTICTKRREHFFGEIIGGTMRLSPIGMIIEQEWHRTRELRPYVTLDEFVVMPNHLHAIIGLHKLDRQEDERVETHRGASLHRPPLTRPPRSLGSIIAGYKSKCTQHIRGIGMSHFAWQRGYYDHVIRNQEDLRRIRLYILNNPLKWSLDPYHPAK